VEADVFWTHLISDAVIALSYFSIPVAILYLAARRPDRRFGRVRYLCSAFIIACGVTHLLGIWTMFVPDYGVEAVAKGDHGGRLGRDGRRALAADAAALRPRAPSSSKPATRNSRARSPSAPPPRLGSRSSTPSSSAAWPSAPPPSPRPTAT
jgi:hypothetical protein